MTDQKPLARIALVGDSLGGGGAEKIHATLSNYLASQGVSVFNIIFVDRVSYSFSGGLLNLGKVAAKSPGPLRKAARFSVLRKFFRENWFDAVVDFRMRTDFWQEWALQKFAYPTHVVYTVHSSVLEFYFPKSVILSRMLYRDKKLVAVSHAIRDRILDQRRANDVTVIHNLFDVAKIAALAGSQPEKGDYILAVGRMNDEIKQFDRLIETYSKSGLPARGIRLVLLGEGKFAEIYRQLARRLKVEDSVEFKGFLPDPFPVYAAARFLVLCSKNEGFPNVIPEALSSGTPVVAFDCVSGPSEIIIDREDGLLVPDQDFAALALAMEGLALDPNLLEKLTANAKSSAMAFDIDRIGPKWLSLLKIDVS